MLLSDELTALVPRLLASDREAEERFFSLVHPKLVAWATQNFFVAEAEREDFALEVIEKVLAWLDKFDPAKAKLTTWMFVIAKRHALDRFCSQNERDPLSGALPEEAMDWMQVDNSGNSSSEAEDFTQSVLHGNLMAALATLAENDRTLLRLIFGTSLNASQIANETGLTPATVRKRKERLLEKLRKAMTERASEAA